MTPLVSVLILTYNHEKFIAQAIESVLAQRVNFNLEILIGNDCSTDATGKIVNDYALKHKELIKVFTPSQNLGALKNEKLLFDNASGKYICFLEGDDFWTDEFKLQKQVDFLEANVDCGLTHGDVNHYYENTGITEYRVNKLNSFKVPEGFIFNELMKPEPFFIKTATVCFRKELISIHFDYELAIRENWVLTDWPLWLVIAYHSKVHYFDEVFATYRLLNESASRTVSPEKKYNFHKSLYRIKQYYIEKYKCDDLVKELLAKEYYRGLIKIGFNMNDKVIIEDAINLLKQKENRIKLKEKIMALGAKHKWLYRLLKLIKP